MNIGDRVRIHGVTSAQFKHLNGITGTIVQRYGSGMFLVKLDYDNLLPVGFREIELELIQ